MKKGFTLVEIMIVIAIIGIVIAMVSVNLVRSKTTAVETNAQTTLKTMGTALESYAGANGGIYATGDDLSELYDPDPKYINKDYVADCTVDSPCQGYSYSCELTIAGYTCTATPNVSYSGARTFQIVTGAKLTEVAAE
ncbi:MAG: prepilin-type N-terminal cleavage/methylation domain-containing protein [Candidatus Omnitrophota bacterium]